LCPYPKKEKKKEEEKNNDKWVSSVILYRNRFGGSNLGAAGVKAKNKAPKNKGSTQIKSGGLVLRVTAGVARVYTSYKLIIA
jgi:hypothetical protein